MSSQTRSPSTLANDASVGIVAWSSPSNASASDDVRATCTLLEQDSNYLKATNFNFSVPSNVYIDGVALRLERSIAGGAGDGLVFDSSIALVSGGVIQGDNKANPILAWVTIDTYVRYPKVSISDRWGLSLTPGIVNASNFGVAVSCANVGAVSLGRTARIDHIELAVYYIDPISKRHVSSRRQFDFVRRNQ